MHKFNNTNDHRFAHNLCKKYMTSSKSICVITENTKSSKDLYSELLLYLEDDQVLLFPENEILPYDHFSTPENIVKDRFKALNNFDKKIILITTIKTLHEKFPERSYFRTLDSFCVNDEISINKFIKVLETNNFKRTDKVESINQYAHRGGIVDVFTPIYSLPIRIEFFDTIIDSIRFFDEKTQSSIKKINSFKLSHGSLVPTNDASIDKFKAGWRKYFDSKDERDCEIFSKISNKEFAEGAEIYLPFFFDQMSTFSELFEEYEFIKNFNQQSEYGKYINQRYEDENIDITRPLILPQDLFVDSNSVNKFLCKVKELEIDNIYEDKIFNIDDVFNNIEKIREEYKRIVILTNLSSEIPLIKNKLLFACKEINTKIVDLDEGLFVKKYPRINHLAIKNKILIIHNESGSKKDLLIDEDNLNHQNILDFNPYSEGDLIVHEQYGLGIYEGLEIINTNNQDNEYIKIKYLNDERLYVPLRNINLLSKYHKSALLTDIELDSISSNKWSKKKEKALKQAYDHAAEILDIESRRANSSSFSLKISDGEFNKFNDQFPYNETKDQLISIDSIRKDLTLIKPMNRLLCGDVGFGKTEVAMRASYIAVYSNKQVIVLCPSTILAKQHYESFCERFSKFPVNIELLTRHVPLKKRNELILSYNSKHIDILISTHAIFSQNIDYSNTGLLVVDEEHRFGIKQKDLIKSKQDNIHILYLSATPIPRTMNFVFSGLKDFSFLNTPPVNRLSIKSFLKNSNNMILKESISREIERGGQCFLLQNNIDKMESLKSNIMKLLPNIKIGLAHGRLNKKNISSVMEDFTNGQIDVLICTTIVEMGLDITNANTMIVEDAHKLGLAQLHQIRGRIGRSNKQGYCYFLVPEIDIPKIAKDRLDSIVRHSKLGSGYFIAQEDMELRGSGEILGDRQSGHVASIGLSLYLSMLKSAIHISKNNYNKEIIKTDVNFYDSAFINENYMPSTIERLKTYKLIYDANSHEDIYKIRTFLEDTCGKIPIETDNLIKNATINYMIGMLNIPKLSSTNEITSLQLSESLNDSVLMKLLKISQENQNIYTFDNKNRFNIKLNESNPSLRRDKIIKILNELF